MGVTSASQTPSAYETGLRIRREVLGDPYVDRALVEADRFASEFQAELTEHCWGGSWARPGLSRRDRSLITLAVLASTGKWQEIAAHTRGALRNGCTVDEVREAFIHVAYYSGFPAAVEAFSAAAPAIAEFDEAQAASLNQAARPE
jgi:alkylhydroperoxidase/carboxymuconolactone decarboxylase family protein YurZ